jgi:ribosomal-protein-alanine N-acetyltransferase
VPVWSIVALGESHLDDIIAIEKVSFRHPWQPISFSNEISRKDAVSAVVVHPDHGRTIAYACLRLTIDELHILRIAVAPEWRRQGIAKWLLHTCCSMATGKGARAVYLEVRRSNTFAIDLYTKLGFKIIAERPKYYMDTGEDALIMKKGLEETK